MEGGGEGLLAIVEGLSDGLSILLLDRKRRESEFRRRLDRRTLKESRSSYALRPRSYRSKGVDTDPCTQKNNTGAQISDGRYASTYQLAHCNVTPSSPPVRLPEFPPQRPEPCRTRGHFKVGGSGSQENNHSLSPSPTRSFGFNGGCQWPDRGSVYNRQQYEPEPNAFVSSLRKYPTSPERPSSVELIQRISKHKKDKNSVQKPSQFSKDIRECSVKQSPTQIQSKDNIYSAAKNIQTYTRSKKLEAFKENGINYEIRHSKTRHKGHKQRFKSLKPGTNREIRARDTFDYLNYDIPTPPPGTACGDRRAVRNVIRNSLREVFGDERGPVAVYPVCPTMQSRYEKHRLEHHGQQPEQNNAAKAVEADGSCSPAKIFGCGFPKPTTCGGSPQTSQEKCGTCGSPGPSNRRLAGERPGPGKADTPASKKCTEGGICSPPFPCKSSRGSNYGTEEKRRLEDVICSWLEELPVYAKENPHDKYIRDAVVKKLISSLALIDDDDFYTKGKEEIKLCIDKMPMWLPNEEKERISFKDKIGDSLFKKIKDFRERDRFKDVIRNWLNGINFDDDREQIDKDKIADDFSVALKPIALNRPLNESLYKEKLKRKTFDLLGTLPLNTVVDKNNTMDLLSDKLADDLIRLPREAIKLGTEELKSLPKGATTGEPEELKRLPKGAIKLGPEELKILPKGATTGEPEELKRLPRGAIAHELEELQRAIKSEPGEIENKLKNTLEKILEHADLNEDKNREAIPNLIPKLKNILLNTSNREQAIDEMEDEICDWMSQLENDNKIDKMLRGTLGEILEIADLSDDKNEKTIESMIPKLKNILSKSSNSENVIEEMNDAIRNWLLQLANDKGIHKDNKTQENIRGNLANKLNSVHKKPKENDFVQPINDWLSALPNLPDIKAPENKKMIEHLANQIQEIHSSNNVQKTPINKMLHPSEEDRLKHVESQIIPTVGKWLRDFTKNTGVYFEPGAEEELSNKLLRKMGHMTKSRKRWEKDVDYDPMKKRGPDRKVKENSRATQHWQPPMDDPDLKEILKPDIGYVPNQNNTNVKNRDDIESNLSDILNDLQIHVADKKAAKDKMHDDESGNRAQDISNKLLEGANEVIQGLKSDMTNYGPSATSTPQKQKNNGEEMYGNEIFTKILNWLNKQDLPLKDYEKNEIAQDLTNDFVDRQKYLQLNSYKETSDKEELENLKYQIFKSLNKFNKTKDAGLLNKVMSKVPNLMDSIKAIPVPKLTRHSISPLSSSISDSSHPRFTQNSTEFVQENLEGGILDWLRESPIYQGKTEKQKKMQEQLVPGLAKSLTSAIKSLDVSRKSGNDADMVLINEIIKHLSKFPLAPKQKNNNFIRKTAEDLLKYLKRLQLFQDISERSNKSFERSLNTQFQDISERGDKTMEKSLMTQFNDVVKNWCNDLPFTNPEEAEQLKQDLNNKIMLKIGELNMNPQIFNDDFLYEEVLSDFIDQQLQTLPIQAINTKRKTADFISSVNEVRQQAKDEMAGQAYKQQLHDSISKTLPSLENPTEDEKSSFEIMKDNLADSFINLHYVGDDKNLKAKFKGKINDEINKFVDDYMRRHPSTPLSAQQLNKDLYSALKKVKVPEDESMKSQVAQTRMKDVIDDWIKEMPLEKQSMSEKLHTNKIMSLMAKQISDIEKDNEAHPDDNYDDRLKNEIMKHGKKLSLKNSSKQASVDRLADELINKVKRTEQSRMFTSGSRSSIDTDNEEFCSQTCPNARARDTNYFSHYTPQIPPCGLSLEDQAHLQRIKERSQHSNIASQSSPCNSSKICGKDAGVNPSSLDYGSQINVEPNPSCQCKCCKCCNEKGVNQPSTPIRSQIELSKSQQHCVSTGSQIELSPYVIIKEYYWDNSSAQPDISPTTPDRPSRPCLSSSFVVPQIKCAAQSGITQQRCRTPEQPCRTIEQPCRSPNPPCVSDRSHVTGLGSSHSNNQYLERYHRPATPRRQRQQSKEEFDSGLYLDDQSRGVLRPHIYRNNEDQELYSERMGHAIKCGCKEKIHKSRGSQPVNCHHCQDDPMRFCAKCCGAQCPHPARLYFR